MPRPVVVQGRDDGQNTVIVRMGQPLLRILGGLQPTDTLVAGMQVELESAEIAAGNVAAAVARIDEAIASMNSTISTLESIKARLLPPPPP